MDLFTVKQYMYVAQQINLQDLTERYRTPQGIYIIDGVSASVGVLPYAIEENGVQVSVGIFTSPDELFRSIPTLIGVPAVVEHPIDFNAEISDMEGIVLNAHQVSEFSLGVTVGLWGDDLLEYITKGNFELSAGYTANVIKKEGQWYGSPYSYIKTDIIYNHLAIVERGTARNGATNKLLIDSNKIDRLGVTENFLFTDAKTSLVVPNFDVLINPNEPKKIMLKTVTYTSADGFKQTAEVDPDLYQYIVSLQKVNEQSTAKIQDSTQELAKIPTLTSSVETLTKELTDSKANIADLEKKIEETKNLLPNYLKIATKAEKLGVTINFENFDVLGVMREALKEKYPNVEDVSEETLYYLFEITTPVDKVAPTSSDSKGKTSVNDSKKSIKTLLNGTRIEVTDSDRSRVISSDELAELSSKRREKRTSAK